MQKILNSGNTKTAKGEKKGWKTYGIHFAPSKVSGFNVCKWASNGCAMACLNTAGRGIMSNVQEARIKKTKDFFMNRKDFMNRLIREINNAVKNCKRKGLKPCFRLNLTSDLPWEKIKHEGRTIFQHFPDCQFYDYTKGAARVTQFLWGDMPKNYHLTFSRSEEHDNQHLAQGFLNSGGNVAMVFRKRLPKRWAGFKVIDGDETDLRFLDGKGVIVGLVEKGLAKKDKTGFVIEPSTA